MKFKLLNQSTIDLLPQCLDKLAECCTQLGDDYQACVFKKFETMYYEQVLVRKSLDWIGKYFLYLKKIDSLTEPVYVNKRKL